MYNYYCKHCKCKMTDEQAQEDRFCHNCGAELTEDSIGTYTEFQKKLVAIDVRVWGVIGTAILLLIDIVVAIEMMNNINEVFSGASIVLVEDAYTYIFVYYVFGIGVGLVAGVLTYHILTQIYKIFMDKRNGDRGNR